MVTTLLFDSVPATFPSQYDLEESVKRLRAASRPWYSWEVLFKQSAVGVVSSTKVRLWRVRPLMHNGFAPQFVGRFVESHGTVTLVGRFTMHPWTKVAMSVSFALFLLWTLAPIIMSTANPRTTTPVVPAFGVEPLIFGSLLVLMLLAGKALSRGDVAWLSEVIQRALTPEGSNHTRR